MPEANTLNSTRDMKKEPQLQYQGLILFALKRMIGETVHVGGHTEH